MRCKSTEPIYFIHSCKFIYIHLHIHVYKFIFIQYATPVCTSSILDLLTYNPTHDHKADTKLGNILVFIELKYRFQ